MKPLSFTLEGATLEKPRWRPVSGRMMMQKTVKDGSAGAPEPQQNELNERKTKKDHVKSTWHR